MKFLILILFTVLSFNVLAEDLIVLKSGEVIKSNVIEIGQSEIKYKKSSNPNGPTYSISKVDVLSITYENGESDKFVDNKSNIDQSFNTQQSITDENNTELLKLYSANDYSFDKQIENKEAKAAVVFYRLGENSIISTSQIEVSFEPTILVSFKNEETRYPMMNIAKKRLGAGSGRDVELKVSIQNKTDQPLYLDLLQCSKSGDIGETRVYYDGTQTIEGGSSTVGMGTSILGIGIGAATTTSSNVVKESQRIMMIPPHGKVNLPLYPVYENDNKKIRYRYDSFSSIDKPTISLSGLKSYEKKCFEEFDSPIKIRYMLSYSDTNDFSAPHVVNIVFYANQIIGIPKLSMGVNGRYFDNLYNIKGLDDKTIVGTVKLK